MQCEFHSIQFQILFSPYDVQERRQGQKAAKAASEAALAVRDFARTYLSQNNEKDHRLLSVSSPPQLMEVLRHGKGIPSTTTTTTTMSGGNSSSGHNNGGRSRSASVDEDETALQQRRNTWSSGVRQSHPVVVSGVFMIEFSPFLMWLGRPLFLPLPLPLPFPFLFHFQLSCCSPYVLAMLLNTCVNSAFTNCRSASASSFSVEQPLTTLC